MNRILNWFRLRRLEGDLDRELQYHIDRRVTDRIHSGLSEPEARRRVAMALGGATQVREEVREIWLHRWLRDFVYDLRFSVRSFLQSPSFTATAVLSLALGIEATTALYSLVDQVVLHALPVDHPERLVLIVFAKSGASLLPHRRRAAWLEFLREVSGNARVSLTVDSGDDSQRRSNIANHLFPHGGRANRSILEHGAYAGGTFRQLRHTGAPALAGWPVRCDVFRRRPAHARDRYSIGARGDTPFDHLAGAPRCAGDDRRGNSDCATLRLGIGPSC